MFGPKREEVTGSWKKMDSDMLHNSYFSSNVITTMKSRKMRWAGQVVRMGEKRHAYQVFLVNPEWKRPLGRLGLRCEDNIKMDLIVIGCEDMGRFIWHS
jgi:hypothetical protein